MGGTDDEGERDDEGEEQVSLTTSSDGYGRRVGGVGLLTPAAVCIVAKREVLDLWGGVRLCGRGGVLHSEVCVGGTCF